MLLKIVFILSTVKLNNVCGLYDPKSDIGLNPKQLIRKYGYPLEEHIIETEDGYLLETHRIPHGLNKTNSLNRSVLLMPGVMCSSAIWVSSGPKNSWGFFLADQGFDVWLANYRGSTWSRKHKSLNPDLNSKTFFDYSFQEIGKYDVPANIDYILKTTKREKLFYIGHSMGTTTFFSMSIDRPKYNNKIQLMVGLAPVAYTSNLNVPFFNILADNLNFLKILFDALRLFEFLPYNPSYAVLAEKLCGDNSPIQSLCGSIINMIVGPSTLFDLSLIPVIASNVPAGISSRSFIHTIQQIKTKKFEHYDFGLLRNLMEYGVSSPPEYNVSKITSPVALFASRVDRATPIEDVLELVKKLQTVMYFDFYDEYNHLDFLFSGTPDSKMYNKVLELFLSNIYSSIMKQQILILLLSIVYLTAGATIKHGTIKQVHPDLGLDTIKLIEKYGFPVEVHTITTEDGYILETHRIPHGRSNKDEPGKIPVLVMPGVVCGSDIWVNMGLNDSLGFVLADKGYDVWLANYRGTTWSRKHQTFDPDTNPKEFFDYSFQEIAAYDVPAMIDYILDVTKQENLMYVGHSQGTTSFFAMAASKPEYQKKIRFMTALAPVAYTTNIKHIIFNLIKKYYDVALSLIETNGVYEILKHSPLLSLLVQVLCNDDSFFQPLCGEIIYFIAGVSTNFDESLLPVITSNTPAGGTTRIFIHYVQIGMAKSFQKYDFGLEANLAKYGQTTPPAYNLSSIEVPTAIFYSDQDTLSIVKDVKKLLSELPNVVYEEFIEDYSHLDYIWASNIVEVVYTDVIITLALVGACLAQEHGRKYQQQEPEQHQESRGRHESTTFIPIIRFDKEQGEAGSYKALWETGNNILAQEEGFLKDLGPDPEEKGQNLHAQVQQGSYTYTAPNGEVIITTYTADENGFHVSGDHLPTPPPVGPEVQKGLDLIFAGIRAQQEQGAREENQGPSRPSPNQIQQQQYRDGPRQRQ
ncbi:hypothetical protein FQR65_LT01144 [Abscondita terminalis]|nr:hypothetical protein FQR65_LT01144 [Abscondita terminalis]